MNLKNYVSLFLLFSSICATASLHSQVTIGSSKLPAGGALLDLQEFDTNASGANASKGLLMPRMVLTDANSLKDIKEANLNSPSEYVGLTVYNLADAKNSNCPGYVAPGLVVWDGTKWQPLSGKESSTTPNKDLGTAQRDLQTLKKVNDKNPGNPLGWKFTMSGDKITAFNDPNGKVTMKEVCGENRVLKLNLASCGLRDLSDLTDLPYLIDLNCSSNPSLTSIPTPSLLALQVLNCNNAAIQGVLDVSKNTELMSLWCRQNKGMTEIKFGDITKLEGILCYQSGLTSLDVSKQINLKTIDCANNKNIKTLNVSTLKDLIYLNCGDTGLSELNLDQNNKLQSLYCPNNTISVFKFENHPDLATLNCSSNPITSGKLTLRNSPKLKTLHCYNNKLSSIDVTLCPLLAEFDCSNNLQTFTAIDLSNNKNLVTFKAEHNALKTLDFIGFAKLETVLATTNKLEAIGLSGNAKLKTLDINFNQIKELDLKDAVALERLYASENNIPNLDLKTNIVLIELQCETSPDNPYKLTTLDLSKNEYLMRLYIGNQNISKLNLLGNKWMQIINFLQTPMANANANPKAITVYQSTYNTMKQDTSYIQPNTPGCFNIINDL